MIYQEKELRIYEECDNFELTAMTTVGDRENQQDCFGYHLNKNDGLIVLCDGMGGHNNGDTASYNAAYHFINNYSEKSDTEAEICFLNRTIKEANKIVQNIPSENDTEPEAGTTAVSLIIKNNQLFWCSSGDSRAYLFRKGEFVQITVDHNYRTVLDEKLRADEISKEQYEKELTKSDALISYLGLNELKLIDYNNEPLNLIPEDIIMLMSDGLYRFVSENGMYGILSNFANIKDILNALESKIRSCKRTSELIQDNTTVIIIKIRNKEKEK